MNHKLLVMMILLLGLMIQPLTAVAAPDPNFHIYLLFGQSNMEGQATPSQQDYETNPRVMVMQDETCSGVGQYGEWRLASPPLIRCVGKLGPGDYFGKTMAENTDPEITIGLVGAAYQGQSIDFFLKDCAERGTCSPVGANGPVPEGHNGGYAWLLDLAKRAQEDGVIKGIIMHQGESDTGEQDWPDRVNAVITDLRNDLGIGDVPFIAGEMVPGACCTAHNPLVHQIPQVVSNGHYVSADGLGAMDYAHFDAEGYREIGRRYAEKMLTLIDTTLDNENDDETDIKFVGNITHSGSIPSDFADYWDQITCENEGKWESLESSRGNMDWSGVDAAYNYAIQHGMKYKHHTFVWGSQYPDWMDSLSQDEQRQEVEELIRLYCERYPDTELIDVVNEPDHATPSWAAALGGSGTTGHDWVIWVFEKARQYCPNSTLILNDYNVLRWDTDNFIPIANKLKERGLLDAIGCQAHGLEDQAFSELQSNFNKIAEIGVPIYISEYDIDLSDDNEQLQVMQQQFPFFYESSQVAGITLWGYIYGQTWKDNTGLIRDGGFRPAMTWLMNYLDRK